MTPERRANPRFKLHVPVEIHIDGNEVPIRCSTSDISLGGCYIESLYTLPVGTHLELKLDIGETLLVLATVVTRDPQVGNGIHFTRILAEDLDALAHYLNSPEAHEHLELTRE